MGKIDHETKKLTRKDVFVYAEIMDEPTIREDKDYIIAGCYNEDKTKFKNIITGEIYDCDKAGLNLDKLNIAGRDFSIIINAGIAMPGMLDIYFTQRLTTREKGELDWFRFSYIIENPLLGDKDWVAKHLSMKAIHEFFINAKDDDEVKLSDVRKMINIFNKLSHKRLIKELKDRQERKL